MMKPCLKTDIYRFYRFCRFYILTERMFDEVTVCEVTDGEGTGFESRDGLGNKQ